MPVQNLIQVRRGTASGWVSANPTLAAGEIGYETDTKRMKVGDGTTAWTSLKYATITPSGSDIAGASGIGVTFAATTGVPVTISVTGITASQVTDFTSAVEGIIATGSLSPENVMDIVGTGIIGSSGIGVDYQDANNRIYINVTGIPLARVTDVTATAAEVNYNDLTTGPGTAEASKTLVLDASKNIASINNLAATGAVNLGTVQTAGALTATGNLATSGTLTVAGTSTLTGAVTTSSSVAVGTNLTTSGTITATGNLSTSGALTVAGSGVFSGNVSITSGLTVGGNLTVNGTTTTVNSTTVTIDDPIFTLGGDTAPTGDDNKDRGIEFRYYDTQARLGFFGYDDSAGKFVFLTAATNTSEVFSGTKGEIDASVDWTNILNVPDPVIAVNVTGDVAGSGNVTVTNLGNGTWTINIGTTIQADSVALGTDTTGDYIKNIAVAGTGLSVTSGTGEGVITTITSNATPANTANTIVSRDASGNFSAGTITATTFSGAHSGDGSALTGLNASNISTGTLAVARLPSGIPVTNLASSGMVIGTTTFNLGTTGTIISGLTVISGTSSGSPTTLYNVVIDGGSP